MDVCLKHQQYIHTQRILNFQPVDVDTTFGEPSPLIAPDEKYDPRKVRDQYQTGLWQLSNRLTLLKMKCLLT